jgi:hypothetical protein
MLAAGTRRFAKQGTARSRPFFALCLGANSRAPALPENWFLCGGSCADRGVSVQQPEFLCGGGPQALLFLGEFWTPAFVLCLRREKYRFFSISPRSLAAAIIDSFHEPAHSIRPPCLTQ